VIHAAGVVSDAALYRQSWMRFAKVLPAKIAGAYYLHQYTQTATLDYFILFSSAAALLGSPGQSNHAAANAYLDSLAHYRKAQGLPALSINWGPWSEIGYASKAKVKLEEKGIAWINPAAGIECFSVVFRVSYPNQRESPKSSYAFKMHIKSML